MSGHKLDMNVAHSGVGDNSALHHGALLRFLARVLHPGLCMCQPRWCSPTAVCASADMN